MTDQTELKLDQEIVAQFQGVYQCARANLQRDGYVQAIALLFGPTGMIPIAMVLDDDRSKDRICAQLTKICKETHTDMVFLISEAWSVRNATLYDIAKPSKSDHRQEVVSINLKVKGAKGDWIVLALINRDDDKPTLSEEMPTIEYYDETSLSRWSNILS
jgi:hypothetical protein